MMNLSGLRLIAPFCSFGEESLCSSGIKREKVQELNRYIEELQYRDWQVRKELFKELENLGGYFPLSPDQGMTNLLICKAAALLASSWEVPFLLKMLWWEEVLNSGDSSLVYILLGGVRKKGNAEDVPFLEDFFRELGKPQRLYYKDGTGKLIALPGIARIRDEVKEAMEACRLRGPREKNVFGGFLWHSAGY